MKWSDLSRVETLLTQRKDLLLDRHRVDNGNSDCSIMGRYQRDYLEDSEIDALNAVLYGMIERRLAEVDSKLLELGITIDPPEAP